LWLGGGIHSSGFRPEIEFETMFAIIEDSGHQLRVEEGQTLTVDLRADAEEGQTLTFDKVLLANGGGASVIGAPVIDGATVEAEVINDLVKGPKLEIQHFRRRKNSRKHTGHRQKYTGVRITAINVPGLEIVEKKEEPAPAAPEAPAASEPATESSSDSE